MVVTVRVEVPKLFATVTVPTEQAAAGVVAGEILQVRATLETSIPPIELMVMIEAVDDPGATVEGENAPAARAKSGAGFTS